MFYMKKAKKLVVGNWKMNPVQVEDAKKIVSVLKRNIKSIKNTNVIVCPPFLYISALSGLNKSGIYLGAQNANSNVAGPLTGEISYQQLPQFGVDFVIVGHSERRNIGETDEMINKKVLSVIDGGMSAIVCIGETKRDPNGDYFDFIKQQILKALALVPKKFFDKIVIAYEPVWAIGAKEAVKPVELQEMSIYIRKVLKDAFGVSSDDIRIIYGGAVDAFNAGSLMKEGNVSGFLVGRQSLDAGSFLEIIRSVDAQ